MGNRINLHEKYAYPYIEHGTHDATGQAQGQCLLSFDRDVETRLAPVRAAVIFAGASEPGVAGLSTAVKR